MSLSLRRIASDACAEFDAQADDRGFAFLRGAYDRLLAVRKEKDIEPAFKLAAFALADFCDRILDDLTRAVPWDDKKEVGDARNAAKKLLHTAFQHLEVAAREPRASLEIFSALGEIRTEYEQLIDELNSRDRQHLAVLGRH